MTLVIYLVHCHKAVVSIEHIKVKARGLIPGHHFSLVHQSLVCGCLTLKVVTIEFILVLIEWVKCSGWIVCVHPFFLFQLLG